MFEKKNVSEAGELGKSSCFQTWSLELNPWGPSSGSGDPISVNCKSSYDLQMNQYLLKVNEYLPNIPIGLDYFK